MIYSVIKVSTGNPRTQGKEEVKIVLKKIIIIILVYLYISMPSFSKRGFLSAKLSSFSSKSDKLRQKEVNARITTNPIRNPRSILFNYPTYAQVRFKFSRALIHPLSSWFCLFFPFIYRIVGKMDNIPNIEK